MHSNEAICKRNPVEQSMCAQSAFPIRKQPKNEKEKKFFAKGVKTFFVFFFHFRTVISKSHGSVGGGIINAP